MVTLTTHVLLISLVFLATSGDHLSGGKHQERNNRMVPDFKPFKHPSKNIDSSGAQSSKSGPISDVEWVEEVVPVFGKINKMQKQEKEGQGSTTTLIFGLIFGGFIAGAIYGNKSDITLKEKKIQKTTEKVRWEEIKTKSEPVKLFEVKTYEKSKEAKENKLLEIKQATNKAPLETVKQEKEISDKKCVTNVDVKATIKCNEITPEVKQVTVTTQKVQHEEVIKSKDIESKDTPMQRATENEFKEAKLKTSQVPLSKRKLFQATFASFEDPEWITKIKTFKITKSPEFNNAGICQHGATQIAVDVLDLVQLEKTEDMKTTLQTATAEMNIEGANTSRLRITVVVDKNEEESLSKTMTIKEFMVSISNQIIDDAVKRVKEECSMENIKHLAETIRKYRPESADIKKELLQFDCHSLGHVLHILHLQLAL